MSHHRLRAVVHQLDERGPLYILIRELVSASLTSLSSSQKLQQFFNHHMFVLEQEEYAREEIAWQFVNFGLELQPTIDLIESNNPMGILSCLDDASIMPKASDKSVSWAVSSEARLEAHSFASQFTTKLHQLASDKPVAPQYTKYTASRLEQGFTVSHYAGKVEYRTEGWLEKNRDPLNDNITSLLSKANDNYVATLFAEYAEPDPSTVAADGPRTRVRKGAFRTVGQRHKEQLSFLMAQLRDTQPHFVRCIVPNLLKSPGKIDVPLVLDQLRCNGVLEGIRIARLGYPNRLPFSEFRRRFDLLAPNLIPKGFVDGGQACDKILKSLQLDSDAYRLGLTKVFFKAGILAELEERRDEVLSDIVTRIQATCRKFVARRQATKVLHRAAAIRTIQRNARVYVQLRAWPWWPLFQRVRPLLAAARNDDEMRRKEEELAAAKEAAEREQVERERLQAVQRELEATQAKMEESLASERALSEEKQMLLLRSKEREQELQTALAAAEQDVETVDRQLDRAMEAKTELDRRVADLNEAYANQNRLLETLQTEQVEWKAREAKLADQTSVQTAEWEKMVKDRQDGISKARDLERKLAEEAQDRKREQDRVAVEKAALERRLATQVTDSTEARQKFVALETEARTAKEDLAGLQRLKRELESTVKAKESELARLTSGTFVVVFLSVIVLTSSVLQNKPLPESNATTPFLALATSTLASPRSATSSPTPSEPSSLAELPRRRPPPISSPSRSSSTTRRQITNVRLNSASSRKPNCRTSDSNSPRPPHVSPLSNATRPTSSHVCDRISTLLLVKLRTSRARMPTSLVKSLPAQLASPISNLATSPSNVHNKPTTSNSSCSVPRRPKRCCKSGRNGRSRSPRRALSSKSSRTLLYKRGGRRMPPRGTLLLVLRCWRANEPRSRRRRRRGCDSRIRSSNNMSFWPIWTRSTVICDRSWEQRRRGCWLRRRRLDGLS